MEKFFREEITKEKWESIVGLARFLKNYQESHRRPIGYYINGTTNEVCVTILYDTCAVQFLYKLVYTADRFYTLELKEIIA